MSTSGPTFSVLASGGSPTAVLSGLPSGPATGPASGANSGAPSTAQLQSIVLRAGDLPSTWTGSRYKPDPSDATNAAAFTQCLGIKDTAPDKVGEADSDDYDMANAEITSQAKGFQSDADVQSDKAGYLSDKLTNCYEQEVRLIARTALPSGTTLDDVAFTFTPGGPASNVIGIGRALLTLTVNGTQASAYQDTAFITGPQIEAEIDFSNVGQPIDVTVENQLINTIAARAGAA